MSPPSQSGSLVHEDSQHIKRGSAFSIIGSAAYQFYIKSDCPSDLHNSATIITFIWLTHHANQIKITSKIMTVTSYSYVRSIKTVSNQAHTLRNHIVRFK